MSIQRMQALEIQTDKVVEDGLDILQKTSEKLAKNYYAGIEELRENGNITGYVKLHFRARLRSKSLELGWVCKHFHSRGLGYESIRKGAGTMDYNLSILKHRAVPGLEGLVEETEGQARLIRRAHRKLLESRMCMRIVQNRFNEVNPKFSASVEKTSLADYNNLGVPFHLDPDFF